MIANAADIVSGPIGDLINKALENGWESLGLVAAVAAVFWYLRGKHKGNNEARMSEAQKIFDTLNKEWKEVYSLLEKIDAECRGAALKDITHKRYTTLRYDTPKLSSRQLDLLLDLVCGFTSKHTNHRRARALGILSEFTKTHAQKVTV